MLLWGLGSGFFTRSLPFSSHLSIWEGLSSQPTGLKGSVPMGGGFSHILLLLLLAGEQQQLQLCVGGWSEEAGMPQRWQTAYDIYARLGPLRMQKQHVCYELRPECFPSAQWNWEKILGIRFRVNQSKNLCLIFLTNSFTQPLPDPGAIFVWVAHFYYSSTLFPFLGSCYYSQSSLSLLF